MSAPSRVRPTSLSSSLPTIDDAPIGAVMPVPPAGQGEPDTLMLPATPGVAIFEDSRGSTVFIAVTGNVRELVRRRLTASDETRTWHTNYREITARVLAIPCWSSLEAEAIYLRHAKSRLPLAYKTVIERWRPWFVQVAPEARCPEWGKTNLVGTAKPREASQAVAIAGGATIGPIRDKDAAGRFIELTIDAFDLCRFPNILEQAPKGVACAYKEMGRCPAPCDGSEPLKSYRARVEEAVRACGSQTRPVMRELFEERMRAAAGHQDFEQAARCKRALARMDQLDTPSLAHVELLSAWRAVVLTRGPRAGMSRVLVFANLALSPIADVMVSDLASARRVSNELLPMLTQHAEHNHSQGLASEHIDHIAAMSRFLSRPAKSRRGEVLPLNGSLDEETLARAMIRVARASGGDMPSDIEDQSVEAM